MRFLLIVVCSLACFVVISASKSLHGIVSPQSAQLTTQQTKISHNIPLLNTVLSFNGGKTKYKKKSKSNFNPISNLFGWMSGKVSSLLFGSSPTVDNRKKQQKQINQKVKTSLVNTKDSSSMRIQKVEGMTLIAIEHFKTKWKLFLSCRKFNPFYKTLHNTVN
jgi:hypothetical protein